MCYTLLIFVYYTWYSTYVFNMACIQDIYMTTLFYYFMFYFYNFAFILQYGVDCRVYTIL
jgi:hypothetical protein